jgi:hypothetical protein
MLTPTFAESLSYLINEQLPPPTDRQTLLFTATITEPVLALSEKTPPAGKQKPVVHLCGPSRCVFYHQITFDILHILTGDLHFYVH